MEHFMMILLITQCIVINVNCKYTRFMVLIVFALPGNFRNKHSDLYIPLEKCSIMIISNTRERGYEQCLLHNLQTY